MQKKDELFVLTKAKDLVKYIITVTERSPKKFRFTLVSKIQNYALDIVEFLFLANNTADVKARIQYQDKAKINLDMLCYFCQIALENQCILLKQYEQISLLSTECRNYLAKWKASTVKKLSDTSA